MQQETRSEGLPADAHRVFVPTGLRLSATCGCICSSGTTDVTTPNAGEQPMVRWATAPRCTGSGGGVAMAASKATVCSPIQPALHQLCHHIAQRLPPCHILQGKHKRSRGERAKRACACCCVPSAAC